MLLRSVYFALRRMLRGYMGYVILILLPLAIITVNGFAIGDEFVDEHGRSGMEMIAGAIIIGFQLVGGFYTMETVKSDLFSENRWRLLSLPYPIYIHTFSILISSVLFNILNGTIMVLFTHWVFAVNWGNMAWVILVLTLVSFVSQLVFLLAVMAIKKYKMAELIGYAYLFLFMLLSGYLFIPIPEIALFDWVNRYINPLTLGETAIIYNMIGAGMSDAYLSMGMLLLLSVVLAVLVVLIGRRRLA
ncbi:ABC transporter permease [Bacillus sp. SD088]|uniref:ABC transporter permease n=1 Tax=Bacillus sp. SD088 TaxID=2782012 RepID=UPI001A976A69|nr:ABC transporter permease [Bacillus sp. SD088]MBO0992644.1 ABC transporter permease [Bacillus sp. SD088]